MQGFVLEANPEDSILPGILGWGEGCKVEKRISSCHNRVIGFYGVILMTREWFPREQIHPMVSGTQEESIENK